MAQIQIQIPVRYSSMGNQWGIRTLVVRDAKNVLFANVKLFAHFIKNRKGLVWLDAAPVANGVVYRPTKY